MDEVNIGILLVLKSIPVLGPIVIEIEGDCLFLFSLFVSDDVSEGLPKAFKDGWRVEILNFRPKVIASEYWRMYWIR